jgi:hypothetical protein
VNVEELLALDRELTNEEFEFIEREALENARKLQGMVEDMVTPRMEKEVPELAQRLRSSVARMVSSLEIAASIPLE